jgi:hypothetical protein
MEANKKLHLTKETAAQMDELLEDLLTAKKSAAGSVIVSELVKNNKKYLELGKTYTKKLLYLIIRLQIEEKIPTLIRGTESVQVEFYGTPIKDFIADGGMGAIYKTKLDKEKKVNKRYYITNLLVVVSIIVPIILDCCSKKKDEAKQAKSISKPMAQPLQKDYPKIHSPKNHRTDSSTKK